MSKHPKKPQAMHKMAERIDQRHLQDLEYDNSDTWRKVRPRQLRKIGQKTQCRSET